MTTLILGGGGFVGNALAQTYRSHGLAVAVAGREPGPDVDIATTNSADLDVLLCARESYEQIVVCDQIGRDASDWIVDRIDGPQWVVFSSAQLRSEVAGPNSTLARQRELRAIDQGATVLRPTMIYGHGRDRNVSVLARRIRQFGIVPSFAGGRALVQPIHIDDVIDAVFAARSFAQTKSAGGCFEIGGSEAVTTAEMVGCLGELLGKRVRSIAIAEGMVRSLARCAPIVGLRPDQFARLLEDKVVDNAACTRAFGWRPEPHAVRLEQAIGELSGSKQRVATLYGTGLAAAFATAEDSRLGEAA